MKPIVTDKLSSCSAAAKAVRLSDRHKPGGLPQNNRAENSHLPIRQRERKQQRFKSQGSAQRFLSTHGAVYNTFNLQPHLISRPGLRTLEPGRMPCGQTRRERRENPEMPSDPLGPRPIS